MDFVAKILLDYLLFPRDIAYREERYESSKASVFTEQLRSCKSVMLGRYQQAAPTVSFFISTRSFKNKICIRATVRMCR